LEEIVAKAGREQRGQVRSIPDQAAKGKGLFDGKNAEMGNHSETTHHSKPRASPSGQSCRAIHYEFSR